MTELLIYLGSRQEASGLREIVDATSKAVEQIIRFTYCVHWEAPFIKLLCEFELAFPLNRYREVNIAKEHGKTKNYIIQ